MIIAGPCLYTDESITDEIFDTALKLRNVADIFRCKLWGGGTRAEIYNPGMGEKGIELFNKIRDEIGIQCITEAQIPRHFVVLTKNRIESWIGGRNSQNYGLIEKACIMNLGFPVIIKRGFGMTTFEVEGIYDIVTKIHGKECIIVERGINTFDRTPESRWSPDLKCALFMKYNRPDIFENFMVDCSHSIFKSEMVGDVYNAFKAIGVNNFMFECWAHPELATSDNGLAISVDDLKHILGSK